jgi:plastocyanin
VIRLPKRCLPLAVALGAGAFMLPAMAWSAETTPVEAVNEPGGYYGEHHRWSPAQETVIAGSAVTFRNPTEVPHGVEWRSAIKPSCEEGTGKVPVGTTPAASGRKWSGACTFSQPGTYTFYCTVHGAEMTGTITVSGTVSATTDEVTEPTPTTATLNGTIKPEGNTTEYHFEYGTTSVSEHVTSTVTLGFADFGSHHVSAALAALTPGTKYHAELVAVYGAANTTVLGGERTFITAPSAPAVATGPATSPNETEATLEGSVDPEGEATEYFFEYGANSSYGQATAVKSLPADNLNHPVTMRLAGLTPGTEYHFRLVAKNSVGSRAGGDHTFVTASPPPPRSSPPPTATTSSVTSAPTLTAPAPPMTTALLPALPGPPLLGGPSLRADQHGSTVRGSLDISPTGAGGRLEVDLLAQAASLAKTRRSGAVRVGRLVRGPVSAGRLSFSVQLTLRAKHALMRHRRLALSVTITLTPPNGVAVTVSRSVVVHA